MGLLGMAAGIGIGLTALVLSGRGWPLASLWFWLLLAAMARLVGLQLLISWFLMRVLEELSQRELRVAGDMAGHDAIEAGAAQAVDTGRETSAGCRG